MSSSENKQLTIIPSFFESVDFVKFEKVKTKYCIDEDITVEYILDDQIVPSSHHWVGLFPRGCTSLRDFLAFEWTITCPREKFTSHHSITFLCKYFAHNVQFNKEYQLLYVNKEMKVLGGSQYFRFLPVERNYEKLQCAFHSCHLAGELCESEISDPFPEMSEQNVPSDNVNSDHEQDCFIMSSSVNTSGDEHVIPLQTNQSHSINQFFYDGNNSHHYPLNQRETEVCCNKINHPPPTVHAINLRESRKIDQEDSDLEDDSIEKQKSFSQRCLDATYLKEDVQKNLKISVKSVSVAKEHKPMKHNDHINNSYIDINVHPNAESEILPSPTVHCNSVADCESNESRKSKSKTQQSEASSVTIGFPQGLKLEITCTNDFKADDKGEEYGELKLQYVNHSLVFNLPQGFKNEVVVPFPELPHALYILSSDEKSSHLKASQQTQCTDIPRISNFSENCLSDAVLPPSTLQCPVINSEKEMQFSEERENIKHRQDDAKCDLPQHSHSCSLIQNKQKNMKHQFRGIPSVKAGLPRGYRNNVVLSTGNICSNEHETRSKMTCSQCKQSTDLTHLQKDYMAQIKSSAESVRLLKKQIDELQENLEKSQAAQKKLKLIAECAKREKKSYQKFVEELLSSVTKKGFVRILTAQGTEVSVMKVENIKCKEDGKKEVPSQQKCQQPAVSAHKPEVKEIGKQVLSGTPNGTEKGKWQHILLELGEVIRKKQNVAGDSATDVEGNEKGTTSSESHVALAEAMLIQKHIIQKQSGFVEWTDTVNKIKQKMENKHEETIKNDDVSKKDNCGMKLRNWSTLTRNEDYEKLISEENCSALTQEEMPRIENAVKTGLGPWQDVYGIISAQEAEVPNHSVEPAVQDNEQETCVDLRGDH